MFAKKLFLILISLVVSQSVFAAKRDPISKDLSVLKIYSRKPGDISIAAQAGLSLDVLTGSSSLNGSAFSSVFGASGNWNLSSTTSIQALLRSHKIAIKGETPGTNYELAGNMLFVGGMFNYYFLTDVTDAYVGAGLGASFEKSPTMTRQNASLNEVNTSPDQTGIGLILGLGAELNLNDSFYFPFTADFLFYGTRLADGNPMSVSLLIGAGYRF